MAIITITDINLIFENIKLQQEIIDRLKTLQESDFNRHQQQTAYFFTLELEIDNDKYQISAEQLKEWLIKTDPQNQNIQMDQTVRDIILNSKPAAKMTNTIIPVIRKPNAPASNLTSTIANAAPPTLLPANYKSAAIDETAATTYAQQQTNWTMKTESDANNKPCTSYKTPNGEFYQYKDCFKLNTYATSKLARDLLQLVKASSLATMVTISNANNDIEELAELFKQAITAGFLPIIEFDPQGPLHDDDAENITHNMVVDNLRTVDHFKPYYAQFDAILNADPTQKQEYDSMVKCSQARSEFRIQAAKDALTSSSSLTP